MRTTTLIPTLTCALLPLLAFAQAADAQGQPGGPQPDGRPGGGPPGAIVRVAGEGEVQADPDHATVRLGAVAQAEDAAAAQQQVNQVMQRALEAVRNLGVDEKNIRTSGLSLYPVYDQPPPDPRTGQAREPQIRGYTASNVITIELSELAKIGDVIDAAMGAGANQLQGVDFALRNDTEARAAALRAAVEQARRKAETLAQATGRPLGMLVEINEAGVELRPPEPMYAARGMAMEAAARTPVQPGQLTVTARVSMVYVLRPGAGEGGGGGPATRPGQ